VLREKGLYTALQGGVFFCSEHSEQDLDDIIRIHQETLLEMRNYELL
jgi:hypothetical protein